MYDKTCWSANDVKVGCNDVNPLNYAEFVKSATAKGREAIEVCYCNTDYCNTGPTTVAPAATTVAAKVPTTSGASGSHLKIGAFIFIMVVLRVIYNLFL